MKRIVPVIVALLLAGIIPISAAPPQGAPTVNDKDAWLDLLPMDKDRIYGGEIIVRAPQNAPGDKKYGAAAGFIVDAGIAEAYRILGEIDKQYEYTKVLDESKYIEITDTYKITQFKVKMFARTWTYRTIHHWDGSKFKIWWTLDPNFDNDFAHFDGSYNLFYIDDTRTLVRYRADLIFKEFLPRSFQQIIIRQDMPHGLADVRRRVNSHGTFKVER